MEQKPAGLSSLTSVMEEYSSTAASSSFICLLLCKKKVENRFTEQQNWTFAFQLYNKSLQNQGIKENDLLDRSSLFTNNSIKGVNLHLWKKKWRSHHIKTRNNGIFLRKEEDHEKEKAGRKNERTQHEQRGGAGAQKTQRTNARFT